MFFLMVVPSISIYSVGKSAQVSDKSATGPLLSDNFTLDSGLNASLWQVNGAVGSIFGPDEVGVSIVTLEPTFSSSGMEISQVNASQEVGTIQSVESFTPPFTATAVVEGIVSNGHTFGFAISNANASSGVVIYGNLNSTNCSHLGDCGNPSVCGTPADSSIAANQCYYGIDAKIGQGGGNWARAAKLYLTPSVNTTYTLQISVSASGNAEYRVVQGGQVLGESSTQVGMGPFYIILEQGEGSPVLSPGPNLAYWTFVSLTPTTTALTSSTLPSSSPSLSSFDWIVIVIIVVLILIIPLIYSRRRGFTVEVQDSRTFSPVLGAAVSADGPQKLSSNTGSNGKVNFGSVKTGEYAIQVSAGGYVSSPPARVHVGGKTAYSVRLDRISAPIPEGVKASNEFVTLPTGGTTTQTPSAQMQQSPVSGSSPVQQGAIPAKAQERQQFSSSVSVQEESELEGWGGQRIRQIVKTFQDKGAISPETALTAQELGLSRLFVRIMKRRKGKTRLFIEINGRYYLNQEALHEME